MPGKRQRARSPSPSPSSSLASSDPGFSGDASESEDHDPKLAAVMAKQALAQSRAEQAKQSKREAEVRLDGDIDASFKPASRAQAVVRESTPPLSVRARPHPKSPRLRISNEGPRPRPVSPDPSAHHLTPISANPRTKTAKGSATRCAGSSARRDTSTTTSSSPRSDASGAAAPATASSSARSRPRRGRATSADSAGTCRATARTASASTATRPDTGARTARRRGARGGTRRRCVACGAAARVTR